MCLLLQESWCNIPKQSGWSHHILKGKKNKWEREKNPKPKSSTKPIEKLTTKPQSQVSYCKININCSLPCREQPSTSHRKHYFGSWRARFKADYNQELMWRSSDGKQNMEQLCLFLLWPPIPWYTGVTGSFSQVHVPLKTLSLCSLVPDTGIEYGILDLFLSKLCEFNQKVF